MQGLSNRRKAGECNLGWFGHGSPAFGDSVAYW
jgi:hypothetical protein